MRIEVVYALCAQQFVELLELADGATVADALAAVAHQAPFCELDLAAISVGIYGEPVLRDTRLRGGDRVELYRPLLTDPKEARRRRAMTDDG
jgi:putative ubiquitin-RnfH superfamily antitoxin RatB of RatAB toxin-antitoxin module